MDLCSLFHVLCILNDISGLQLLQKENAQLTSKVKELLQELDNQKEQNNLLLDEIARLVTSVKDIKVQKF